MFANAFSFTVTFTLLHSNNLFVQGKSPFMASEREHTREGEPGVCVFPPWHCVLHIETHMRTI
jgi:hypothetical protein